MRIGINGSSLIAMNRPVSEIVDHAVEAERDGFASYWIAQLAVPDALTVLGAVGRATSTIELGTAVIATWLRHPLMLAAQALTVSDMAGGRLALGIGLAHKTVIEERLRIPFDRPARHMEEYLAVLLPALRDRSVDATGAIWSGFADATGGPPDVPAPAVLLAAMGPRMLELAGGTADGNILWLSGPRTIETLIAPAMAKAAADAGREPGRIVASVPVCVTDQADDVRGIIATFLADYNDLPSYRGVMDVEGVDGPAGVSLIGDEEAVRAGIQSFADAGTTDFTPVEFALDDESRVRTRALLKSLL
jgi:5,10-methylenetetrahydromethanopterin reductase